MLPGPGTTAADGGGGPLRWWELDKLIVPWVRVHPTAIEQAARHPDFGFKGKYKPAAHRLSRLRKSGKIARVGIIPRDGDGRPQLQYSGWDVGNNGLHEYYLTKACMVLRKGTWVRGPKVSQKRRPDAEWTCDGKFVNVEMDLGTESEKQWRDRTDNYRGCTDLLLVIVHNAEHPSQTAQRVLRLMAWSETVKNVAFFLSLDELTEKSWDAPWADVNGKRVTLRTMLGSKA